MSVTVKDRGLLALLKRVDASKRAISVGVHEAEGSATTPDGATVADIATWNHFGTDRIPARPFLTGWFDANTVEIRRHLENVGRKIVAGAEPRSALEPVALWAEGGVKAHIAQGVPPPNAPSTIARKGSSKPLIDTGQLRSSIRGRVV